MLTEHERRALQQIEHGLRVDHPDLAPAMQRTRGDRTRWTRRATDATTVFAVMLAVLCIALGEIMAGLIAAAVAFLVLGYRRHRFPAGSNHWRSSAPRGVRAMLDDDDGGTPRTP